MFAVSVLADDEVFPMVKAEVIRPRDLVRALEADILAITGITRAGVTQTNYELH